jgi:AraC-like DNA-binding protein
VLDGTCQSFGQNVTIVARAMESRAPSALSSWARLIVRALAARGIDGRALAVQAGLDVAALDRSNARYELPGTKRLWSLAVAATGDASFGLYVSQFARETNFHALGYSVVASRSLKDAFGRMVRYSRIVSDSVRFRLEEERALYRLVVEVPAGLVRPADEAMDALLSLIVRLVRWVHDDPSLNPLGVALERAEPAASQAFRRFFRAPIHFSAPADYLEFAKGTVEAPLPSGNAELAQRNDAVIRSYLARADDDRITSRVQAIVAEGLPDGRPTQESVARMLAMSLRSLQRRLTAEGTSYKQILGSTRRDLACSYVREAKLSLTEIAFLLGFMDSSSFCRQFKRWTGQPPSRYRAERRPARRGVAP